MRYQLRTFMAVSLLASLPLGFCGRYWHQEWRTQCAVKELEQVPCGFDYYLDGVSEISSSNATDVDLKQFIHFPRLAHVRLASAKIDGLVCLQGVDRLWSLDLSGCEIATAEFRHLANLASLEELNLNDTPVTDKSLRHVRSLRRLRSLSLCNCAITDQGLEHLQPLVPLQSLNLSGTRVTAAGLLKLRGLKQLQRLTLIGIELNDREVRAVQGSLPHDCVLIRRVPHSSGYPRIMILRR